LEAFLVDLVVVQAVVAVVVFLDPWVVLCLPSPVAAVPVAAGSVEAAAAAVVVDSELPRIPLLVLQFLLALTALRNLLPCLSTALTRNPAAAVALALLRPTKEDNSAQYHYCHLAFSSRMFFLLENLPQKI
jgi:hypothetical protein